MADYIVKDTELTSVANAIRTAGGTNSLLSFPNGFISAVGNISGGGGSSDFSAANVTIVGTTPDTEFECISIDEDGMYHTIYVSTGSGTATALLYKGSAILININEYEMSISGDIEYDHAMDEYTITGDCTITIS